MTLIDDDVEPEEITLPQYEPLAPGVYDMPADDYHRRPELSSSGMRKLLPPNCPALFHWESLNPAPPKKEFDFGHVAHKLILGVGHEIQVLEYDNFLTKAAKEDRKDAYEQGLVPILERDYRMAQAMAAEVRKHPVARGLLSEGEAEQCLFWKDPSTGTEMRARIDWRHDRPGSRLKVVDYKSAVRVDAESISRAIQDHGYHQQGATYREACQVLGLGGYDTVVNLIFQQKTAPFLVHVVQIPEFDLRIGAARNRRAIEIYRECTESGVWPGYDEVSRIEIPAWAQNRDAEEYLHVQ